MNWGSFDSFFNNGLLRRPRRASLRADSDLHKPTGPTSRPASAIRCSSRPHGTSRGMWDKRVPRVARRRGQRRSRIGMWTDASRIESGASRVGTMRAVRPRRPTVRCRRRPASRFPRPRFVLRVLMIYLVILVPVNWAVFRLWGRVEWAWAAAPLIAHRGRGGRDPTGPTRYRVRAESHGNRRARNARRSPRLRT